MSNETTIIVRHSAPGNLDCLPYGTACKVIVDGKMELYIQSNRQDDGNHPDGMPNWVFIGVFDKNVGDFIIQEEIDNICRK